MERLRSGRRSNSVCQCERNQFQRLGALDQRTNDTKILVPANAIADGFSYTIADSHGARATGTATISIITNVTSRGASPEGAPDHTVTIGFTVVPWHYYVGERATNVAISGVLQSWPVQAWADSSICVWDDFTDLTAPQAFYRLKYP